LCCSVQGSPARWHAPAGDTRRKQAAGFTAAVQDGYFQVIAYSNTVTLAADGSLAKALKASHSYYLAQQVNLSDVFGPVRYDIWVKGHKPAAAGTGTGKKAKKPKKS